MDKGGRVCVRVNGEPVLSAQVDAEAERMRKAYQATIKDLTPEGRERQLLEWAQENVIEQILLRQAAMARIEPTDPDALERAYAETATAQGGSEAFSLQMTVSGTDREEVLADLDARLRVERLLQSLYVSLEPPSEAEALAYFRENAGEFQIPELVRAGHIVVHADPSRTPGEAERIIAQVAREIQGGATFEDLAARVSDCPENDGDLGWFPRGVMVEEFENAVFVLERNQTSGVIRSPFGFHIAKLYDRASARPMSFEQAREQVHSRLLAERKERALEAFVDGLRAEAEIEHL